MIQTDDRYSQDLIPSELHELVALADCQRGEAGWNQHPASANTGNPRFLAVIEFESLPKERIDTEHEQRVVCDARDTRANELPPRADDRVVATREAEDRIGWAESVSIEQSEHARSELSTPRSSFVRTVGRAWIEGVPITLDAGSRLRLTPTAGRQLACRFLGETRGRTDDRELHVTSADPSEVYS